MGSDDTIDGKDKNVVTKELRGETIAYALQNGLYSLAANFVEPYIGYRTQKYYSVHDAKHPAYGNYTQNLLGEFVGDVAGAGSLIIAETVTPKLLHTILRNARTLVDPLYTTVAHRVFAAEKSSPDYEQKVQQWALSQERNLVRSSFMATFGIVGNIAAQKFLIGNPSPTSVIFKGKLLSSLFTTSLGLAARIAFPRQLKGVDNAIAKKISPLLEDVHGVASVPPAATYAGKIADPTNGNPGPGVITH